MDASNAFNSLNRIVALHNIRQLCPPFAPILINIYRSPASLFISGDVILSEEGTTQGDPLAMPFYALATIPLLRCLPSGVEQVWYADDACACGKLTVLRKWWDCLCEIGPSFGYFVNATKTWLIIKGHLQQDAASIFSGSGIGISMEGRPYLGAAIGSDSYVNSFVVEKVKGWSAEVKRLSRFAESQPHAAYCAFTHGLSSRWLFVFRTVPCVCDAFQPLEDMIRQVFIPTLTGCSPPSDSSQLLFALPARWGGLGIFVPTRCVSELAASRDVTEPLSQCILNHDLSFVEAVASQQARKALLRKAKSEHCSTQFAELYQQLGPSLRHAIDLATVRGASSWLTTLPLSEHGFTLHRSAFQDALALRYGWSPLRPPSLCACGTSFSVEHALSCPKGGLPSLRHNEIRDLTATLLTEVCSQVCVEPELQPVQHSDEFPLATSNTQDSARLDVAVNGFCMGWSFGEMFH